MADEEHARAGKEWLTSWKMGWRVCGSVGGKGCCYSDTRTLAPTGGAAADDDTRLGGNPRWGRERVGRCPGLEVTTNCDADVHVRSGGEGLKSLPLPHSIRKSVPSKSWTRTTDSVRCSPRQGTRAVRQNRELGLAKTRGWGPQGLEGGGNLGVHPSLWLIARPGRAASGPGHARIMLRCFPGVHACLILQECKHLSAAKAWSRTGRSSDFG